MHFARLDYSPPQVRFLITTRPLENVLNLFPTAPKFDLIKNAPPGTSDLPAYLTNRLQNLPPERQALLVELITEQPIPTFRTLSGCE